MGVEAWALPATRARFPPDAGPSQSGTPCSHEGLRAARTVTRVRRMSPLAHLTSAPQLREDIRRLGDLLGQSLIRQEGEATFELVERIRTLVREDPDQAQTLVDELPLDQATTLARAFSLYFSLANVAEQVHRATGQAARRARTGGPLAQAGRAIAAAVAAGEVDGAAVTRDLGRIAARPVFTAHPTEASRRSVLVKLRRIADRCSVRPRTGRATPTARSPRSIDLLWQTDELRLEAPEVIDEARNVLLLPRRPGRRTSWPRCWTSSPTRGSGRRPGDRPPAAGRSRSAPGSAATATATRTSRPTMTARVLALQHDHAVRDLLAHIDGAELGGPLGLRADRRGDAPSCACIAGRRPGRAARPRSPATGGSTPRSPTG